MINTTKVSGEVVPEHFNAGETIWQQGRGLGHALEACGRGLTAPSQELTPLLAV